MGIAVPMTAPERAEATVATGHKRPLNSVGATAFAKITAAAGAAGASDAPCANARASQLSNNTTASVTLAKLLRPVRDPSGPQPRGRRPSAGRADAGTHPARTSPAENTNTPWDATLSAVRTNLKTPGVLNVKFKPVAAAPARNGTGPIIPLSEYLERFVFSELAATNNDRFQVDFSDDLETRYIRKATSILLVDNDLLTRQNAKALDLWWTEKPDNTVNSCRMFTDTFVRYMRSPARFAKMCAGFGQLTAMRYDAPAVLRGARVDCAIRFPSNMASLAGTALVAYPTPTSGNPMTYAIFSGLVKMTLDTRLPVDGPSALASVRCDSDRFAVSYPVFAWMTSMWTASANLVALALISYCRAGDTSSSSDTLRALREISVMLSAYVGYNWVRTETTGAAVVGYLSSPKYHASGLMAVYAFQRDPGHLYFSASVDFPNEESETEQIGADYILDTLPASARAGPETPRCRRRARFSGHFIVASVDAVAFAKHLEATLARMVVAVDNVYLAMRGGPSNGNAGQTLFPEPKQHRPMLFTPPGLLPQYALGDSQAWPRPARVPPVSANPAEPATATAAATVTAPSIGPSEVPRTAATVVPVAGTAALCESLASSEPPLAPAPPKKRARSQPPAA